MRPRSGLFLLLLATGSAAETPPRYSASGVEWVRLDAQGQPLFVAQAERIGVQDDRSAVMQQPRIRQLGGDRPGWTLEAPQGRAAPGAGVLQLEGGVRVEGYWPDGEPLEVRGETFRYQPEAQRLDSDQPVQLSSASRRASAEGLQAEMIGRQLKLLGQVRMSYAP